jgi:stage V sporulation protein B
LHIAKQSAQGSVVLFVGNLVATAFAAAASIIVARLLGPADFGVFTLSLVIPNLLQLFTHFGTRTAVTRYVAQHRSIGDIEAARRFAKAAIVFSLAAGSAFSLFSFYAASVVASSLFQRPDLAPYVELASFAVLGNSILLTVIAVSTGWNAMGQASLANVLQSVFKLAASPLLIILGFGVAGAIVGHASSLFFGGLCAGVILYFTKLKSPLGGFGSLFVDMKEMVRFGFYPFIGNVLTGLSSFYALLILAVVANNTVIGYYSAATNLIIPATLLSTAIASALYPAFASLHGTQGDTGSAFQMSMKYVGYLIVPILFFLAASSAELLYLFYGPSYTAGSSFLVLLALAYSPILLGASILPQFFTGIGRTRLTLFATGTAAVVLLAGAPVLAILLGLGVNGLIYALFGSNLALAVVGLLLVRLGSLGRVNWRSAGATLVAAMMAFGASWLLPSFSGHLVLLVVKFVVFSLVYLTFAPLLGALTPADVERLDASLKGLPLVGRVVAVVASYEKYLAIKGERG